MPPHFGSNAAIAWTDNSSQRRVHLLAAPLRAVTIGHTLASYTRESLDRSVVEYFSVPSGAYELVGTVRYDQNAQSLADLVRAGGEGKTLTYYPDLDDSDLSAPVKLLSPLGDAPIGLDGDRGVRGEYSVELRFRTTDGGIVSQPFWRRTELLFQYSAGDNLGEATFSRVTSAAAPASFAALPAYGTLSTAKSNQARVQWISTVSSAGPRVTPTLLLETGRRNTLQYSQAVNSWSSIGTPILTASQSDPKGGTAAFLLGTDSTAAAEGKDTVVKTTANGQKAVSYFVRQGTTANTAIVKVVDDTAAATRYRATIAWSSQKPTHTITVGGSTGSTGYPERWRGNWWRMGGLTTTGVLTASTNHLRVYPATTGSTAVGDIYVFGFQVED